MFQPQNHEIIIISPYLSNFKIMEYVKNTSFFKDKKTDYLELLLHWGTNDITCLCECFLLPQ